MYNLQLWMKPRTEHATKAGQPSHGYYRSHRYRVRGKAGRREAYPPRPTSYGAGGCRCHSPSPNNPTQDSPNMYIQNERANILPESNTDSRQWQRLKRQLGDCKECAHHYTRHHMFLYRGHIPCDILFISQYSTSVDDMTGLPMAHNGQRDTIANIRATSPDNTTPGTSPIKTGVTCLMACHAETPTNKQIDTCSTHIHKIVEMCTPAAIIYLGPKRPGYINDLSTHVFYAEHPHTILSNTDAIKRITARRSIEKAVERATEVVYNTNKIFDVGKPR